MSLPTQAAVGPTHSLDRDAALDGVRGIAVVMVMSIHLFVPVQVGALTGMVSNVFNSMFIATDLFFVLSGFLITAILLRTRERQGYFRSFYWRRALRILPAYAVIWLYAFILAPALLLPPEQAAAVRGDAVWYAVYLHNIEQLYTGQPPGWVGLAHLWSLAIEEQFYLLWPVAIFFVPRRHLEKFCIGVFFAGCAIKLTLLLNGASWSTLYVLTPCRIEGLAAGAWIATRCELRDLRQTPSWLRVLGAVVAAVLLYLIVTPEPSHGAKLFNPTLIVLHNMLSSIVFAWMIYEIVQARPGHPLRRLFNLRPLIFLGTYSYGIYLIHYFVLVQIRPWFGLYVKPHMSLNWTLLLMGIATLAITIPLALLLYRWVEKPAMDLKDWVKTRQPKPAGAGGERAVTGSV